MFSRLVLAGQHDQRAFYAEIDAAGKAERVASSRMQTIRDQAKKLADGDAGQLQNIELVELLRYVTYKSALDDAGFGSGGAFSAASLLYHTTSDESESDVVACPIYVGGLVSYAIGQPAVASVVRSFLTEACHSARSGNLRLFCAFGAMVLPGNRSEEYAQIVTSEFGAIADSQGASKISDLDFGGTSIPLWSGTLRRFMKSGKPKSSAVQTALMLWKIGLQE